MPSAHSGQAVVVGQSGYFRLPLALEPADGVVQHFDQHHVDEMHPRLIVDSHLLAIE